MNVGTYKLSQYMQTSSLTNQVVAYSYVYSKKEK